MHDFKPGFVIDYNLPFWLGWVYLYIQLKKDIDLHLDILESSGWRLSMESEKYVKVAKHWC
jgi:hypothetical protein